jgi:peptide/nickel transport system substrate-binding protein
MKRTRILGFLVLFLAVVWVAFFFIGKKKDIPDNAILTIPLEAPLQTLDPAKLSDPITSKVVWAIYEGLVELDRNGKVIPLLAESWNASNDQRRWTFKIRRGVYFHMHPAFGPQKTREVTAQDVVYSYQRLARGFGSFLFHGLVEGFDEYVSGHADKITGIRVVSQYEVSFELTRPDPSFIYRITSPYLAIMPQEVIEADPDAFRTTSAIGTGPFMLESVEPTEITLKRNPRYWRHTHGNIETVRFIIQTNPLFRLQSFRSGHFDLIEVPPEFAEEFMGRDGSPRRDITAELVKVDTYNVHYLGFDMEQLKDRGLRIRVQRAIDRQQLVKKLLPHSAIAWSSPVPPGMQGYSPPPSASDNNEALVAPQHQADIGPFELLVSSDTPNHADVAQLLQEQLREAGVKVDIKLVDFNNFVTRLFSKNRPPFFLGYSEWVYSAPELVMEQFRSSAIPNPNLFHYDNPTVDDLIGQFGTMSSRADLNILCSKIEEKVRTDPPAIWLYHMVHNYALKEGIKDFAVTGDNHWLLEDVRVGTE